MPGMQRDAKMKQAETRKIKITLGIFLISVFFVAIFMDAFAGYSSDPSFGYISGDPGSRFVNVYTGKTHIVPFEFKAEPDVSSVRLEIEDGSLRERGIYIEDNIVPVNGGTASSKAIFKISPGAKIKAGQYNLVIIARSATNGKIIGKGDIPFALNMNEVLWKCSC